MKIVFLHQKGGGVVKEVLENGRISIEDEDGFSRTYLPSQIAPVFQENYPVDDNDVMEVLKQDQKRKDLPGKTLSKNTPVPEIDLHIEALTDSHKDLSNYEILSRQMMAFRAFYNKSKAKRIRKIVVIHGVGQGVLRYEIRSFLNKESNVEFYDADYKEYGQGATVIEMWGKG